jgi:polyether ionophore transport system permease protein
MSGAVTAAPSQVAVASGRHPGTVIAALTLRRAARSATVWGVVFGGFVAAQMLAYASTYRTPAARNALQAAYGSNAGLNALLGEARRISTVAGYAEWRLVGILSIVGAIWGLLTATRLMRGDEEAGRADLLLAGPTTRTRATGQQLAGLGGGLVMLYVLTGAGTALAGRSRSIGFSLPQSLYLAATLVASAAVFLAVGALTSQLASTRRRAAGLACTVFGIAFALRMAADSDRGLHWLVWLSPLGWIEQIQALTRPDPVALAATAALVAVLTGTTVWLAGDRDTGAAVRPARGTAEPHLALLGGPARLALRLSWGTAAGWLLGIAALSVLIGSLAEGSTKDAAGSVGVRDAIGRLGGHGALVDVYLGLTFLAVALMTGLLAAGQAAAIRAEEAEGRLENLLVRSLGRGTWLAGRLGLSVMVLVLAGAVAGLAAWAGAAPQHSGVGLGSLLLAGLNIVPPALLLLGLGALVFGAWPRGTSAVVYGYLAWSFLVEFFGAIVHANHWLMDTSVIFHMVPAPATSPDWASATAVTGVALAAAAMGGFLFRRRDVTGG